MDNNKVMYQGTGRRKDSVAQVILTPGTGKIMMNGKEASDSSWNCSSIVTS